MKNCSTKRRMHFLKTKKVMKQWLKCVVCPSFMYNQQHHQKHIKLTLLIVENADEKLKY